MDSLHGQSTGSPHTRSDDDAAGNPAAHSERRMQVRAYSYWASLLNDNQIPAIDSLDRTNPGNFGPNSILLDLTSGSDTPVVVRLGHALAQECGISAGQVPDWSALPEQTLLVRLAGHYQRMLETRTPIGFEDGFVNQRGATILYRGIVLPFSADGASVDFILGVINWKEINGEAPAHSLRPAYSESETEELGSPSPAAPIPLTDWADGPAIDTLAPDQASSGADQDEASPSSHDTAPPQGFETITSDGPEFALILVQRQPNGTLSVLGEVQHDPIMLLEATRKLRQ